MVVKKEQTPENLYIEFLEKALKAVENGEKTNIEHRQQIEDLRKDLNFIMQRLAVMDAADHYKKDQEIEALKTIKALETRVQLLSDLFIRLDTKIITAAIIIGGVLGLIQFGINIVT